jgi:hypothetical protein
MEKNTAVTIVKVYAVLAWLGALFALIAALALFGIGSMGMMGMMGDATGNPGLLAGLAGVFGVFLLIVAVFDVIVGFGLWNFKPWARIVAIVMNVINLFSFPIGTIIGLIGLWLFGFEPTVNGLFTSAPASTAKKRR